MNEKNLQLERIDAFLLGHLSEKEKLEFEQSLLTNSELSALVDKRKTLIRAMEISGQREMKLDLKVMHDELFQSKTRRLKFNWRPLLAAAAISIVGIAAWFLYGANSVTNEQLFAQHFETFQLSIAQRNAAPEVQLAEAVQFYKLKEYDQAIPIFERLIANDELDQKYGAQLKLALANALFHAGDKDTAFDSLLEIIATNDPFLSDEARWYAGLFKIKENKPSEAIPFLKNLSENPRADHHQEAKEILNSLNP